MDSPSSLLVFSDIDGTLLDHHTYSFEAAKPALARLKRMGAGVVLASSKTAAEVVPIRSQIGFEACPAIVENGAGVLWDDTPSFEDADYLRIRAVLEDLQASFLGFGDMTAEEVAGHTSLPADAADRAKRRHFSEPGVWTGSDAELSIFLAHLQDHGLTAVRGGRFLTISAGRTKAMAMGEVVEKLAPSQTIALGDAPNDVEMLEAADRAALVANPSAPKIPPMAGEMSGMIIRTKAKGPAGWAEAIAALLPAESEAHCLG